MDIALQQGNAFILDILLTHTKVSNLVKVNNMLRVVVNSGYAGDGIIEVCYIRQGAFSC